MGDVILFPPSRVVNPQNTRLQSEIVPQNLDQVKDKVRSDKVEKITKIMEVIADNLTKIMIQYNITPITETEDIRYTAFMIKSIEGLLYRKFGLEHPFNKLAERTFVIDNEMLVLKSDTEKTPA